MRISEARPTVEGIIVRQGPALRKPVELRVLDALDAAVEKALAWGVTLGMAAAIVYGLGL